MESICELEGRGVISMNCTLIKLLWARVALFFVVCEHDLTMDALLENGLTDIKCCYHSNIIIPNDYGNLVDHSKP